MFGNNLFRCVVEDNRDPKFLGRVRLRVMGVHTPYLKTAPTEELPWSDVLQSPGMSNIVGGNINIPIGTWGYCVALNESFTEFLMIGAIKGKIPQAPETDDTGEKIGFRGQDDIYPFPLIPNEPSNPLERPDGDHSKTQYAPITVDSFTEPENTAANVEYPHNFVYEDHNGNIIEIDGSKDNPRIRIQHATGTRIDINTKGDVSIQASSTGNVWLETPGIYAIDADGNIIIEGDLKIVGNIEATQTITAGVDITAKGQIDDSKGTLDSLRQAYNSHTHMQNDGNDAGGGVNTDGPSPVDPENDVPDFTWQGYPV